MLETRAWCSALSLLIATGCTSHHMSTETGNPPVIDSSKIALVVTRDEVHVRGEAGAIMPPEADVEITIVRTRDATLESVEDDGSFDVEVEATIDDVFEVRAVLGDLRSDVVIVDRGGAMVVGGNGGSGGSGGTSGMSASGSGGMGGISACDEQANLGRAELNETLAVADRSCEVDADCMGYYAGSSCFADCFSGFFSEEGLQSVRAAVEDIDNGVCATFEDSGCELTVPPCLPPGEGFCVDGQCTEERGGGSCEACLSASITWFIASSGVLLIEPSDDVNHLSGCGTYLREARTGACRTTVPQCGDAAGAASIEELQRLLDTDEVQAAVALGGWQGEPEATAGLNYLIIVDEKTFHWRSCAGVAGVECLPRGPVEMLIDVLTRLHAENRCEIADADCSSPWLDDGACDAAIPSWWHDPATGACGPRTYGGCGGNDNRYPSLEACHTACPPPITQDDCGPGRQVREVCSQCGLGGGCMKTQQVCALECDGNEDCMGELDAYGATATCNVSDGVCQVGVIGCI